MKDEDFDIQPEPDHHLEADSDSSSDLTSNDGTELDEDDSGYEVFGKVLNVSVQLNFKTMSVL